MPVISTNPNESKQRYSALLTSVRVRDAALKLMPQLERLQREVVCARYGLGDCRAPLTMAKAAAIIGITKASARHHEETGLARLIELGLDVDPFAKFRK